MEPSQSVSVLPGERRLQELREELSRARIAHRAEKKEYREELSALAAARNDADAREQDADGERERLLRLRRRLLARWNERWGAERKRIREQETRLAQERTAFEADRQNFEEEQARFAVDSAKEKAQLQKAWEDFNAEEQDWRVRWLTTEAAHRERERELGEYAGHVAAMERSWRECETALKNACAERGDELAGLERRILALRQQLPMPHRVTPAVLEASPVRSDDGNSLPDNGLRLFLAREEWRGEQIELFGEMEQIGEAVLERELAVGQREEAIAEREQSFEREERELRHERRNLTGLQTRLRLREFLGLADADFLRAEIRHLRRVRKRLMADTGEGIVSWMDRAAAGEESIRTERERNAAILESWTGHVRAIESERERYDELARDLNRQAAAIARARSEFAETIGNPAIAEKRIELHENRLRRSYDRTDRELALRRQELSDLIGELRESASAVAADAAELSRERSAVLREFGERELELHRERITLIERVSRGEFLEDLRNQYERTIDELREEIDRMSRLLYEGEPLALSRAA